MELWKLRQHIIGMIGDYNARLNRLEESRKPYISYSKYGIRGLALTEPLLEKVL
jgi:hypothetical protein